MAKQKVKVPRHVAGIKLKKRHRKQLKALVKQIEKVEGLIAAGTALIALLGIAKGAVGKGDKHGRAVTH